MHISVPAITRGTLARTHELKMRRWSRRRENNKTVAEEEGIRKIEEENVV